MFFSKAKKRLLLKAGEAKRDLLFRMTGNVDIRGGSSQVRVLVYHGVVPALPFRFNTRFISCRLFEEHLKLLSKHCRLISHDDLKTGNIASEKPNVLLTFDDGYANNYKYAFPLLKKYKAPALFFVTSNRADQWLFNDVMDVFPSIGPERITLNNTRFSLKRKGVLLKYVDAGGRRASEVFHGLNGTERQGLLEEVFSITPKDKFRPLAMYLDLMADEDIKEINRASVYSVGAHGSTHTDLSLLSPLDLAHELHQVQSQLSALLGKPCSSLAFPYGRYNAGVIKAGSEAGFMDFFGTEYKNGNESLVTERLTINPFVSAANELYYISKGSHE